MRMNTTELIARDWLINEKGYSKSDITKNNGTPDFICRGGKRYEIKKLYGNKIIFYSNQTKILKDEDFILVFDGDKIKDSFQWKDKDKSLFEIIEVNKNCCIVLIEEDTHKQLKELAGELYHKKLSETVSYLVYEYRNKYPMNEKEIKFIERHKKLLNKYNAKEKIKTKIIKK
jgi:hypothetical protein